MTAQETTPLELVRSKLQAAGYEPERVREGCYQARCPVHQGPEKSLIIQQFAAGPVFFYCSRGDAQDEPSCTTEAIVAALSLRLNDLKIQPEEPVEGRVGQRSATHRRKASLVGGCRCAAPLRTT